MMLHERSDISHVVPAPSLASSADSTSRVRSPGNVTENSMLFMAPIDHYQLKSDNGMCLPGLPEGFLQRTRVDSIPSVTSSTSPVTLGVRSLSPFSSSVSRSSSFSNSDDFQGTPTGRLSFFPPTISPLYAVTSPDNSGLLPLMKESFGENMYRLKRKHGQIDSVIDGYVKSNSPNKKFKVHGLAHKTQEECIGKILKEETKNEKSQNNKDVELDSLAAHGFRDNMTDICSSEDEELIDADLYNKAAKKVRTDAEFDDWGLTVPKEKLNPFLEAVSTQLLRTVPNDLLPTVKSSESTIQEKYNALKLKNDKLNYMYMKELNRAKRLGL